MTNRKEDLENRKAVVDIHARLLEVKAVQKKLDDETENRRLNSEKLNVEIEKLRVESEIAKINKEKALKDLTKKDSFLLLVSVGLKVIDEDKTILSSEPVYKSLWTDEELAEIKKKILDSL